MVLSLKYSFLLPRLPIRCSFIFSQKIKEHNDFTIVEDQRVIQFDVYIFTI